MVDAFPPYDVARNTHLILMKRRDFLSLGAGSAIAVAAPLPRLGIAAPVAQAPRNLYVWAVAMARAGNPISVNTLELALKVPAEQAHGLIGKLVSRGVVNAPNAAGVARAMRAKVSQAGHLSQPSTAVASEPAKTTLRRSAEAFVPDRSDEAVAKDAQDQQEATEADPVSSPPTYPPTP